MKSFVASLVVALSCLASASAGQVERVVYHLPFEGQRQYLTVDGGVGNAKFGEVRASLDDSVIETADGEQFGVLPLSRTTFPLRQSRSVLAVKLQNDDGAVVYAASGRQITSAAALEADIAAAHRDWRINCHRRNDEDRYGDHSADRSPAPSYKLQIQKQPEPPRPVAAMTGWLSKSLAILLAAITGGLGGVCYVISTERVG